MRKVTKNPLIHIATASLGVTCLSVVLFGLAVPGSASNLVQMPQSETHALRLFVDEQLISCADDRASAKVGFSRQ